jgi:hypothetical protein
MSAPQTITVHTPEAFRQTLTSYAARGFQTLRDEGNHITLSKKKPFNWVAAIICLFIPIIGWAALAVMLMAAGRGAEVVEIILAPQAS